jgi:hypothetical protein
MCMLKFNKTNLKFHAWFTKVSDGFNLILENNWLNKLRAHIDYDFKACILYKRNFKNHY